MLRIRLVHYYPAVAADIPVREICDVIAGAGSAIRVAGANRAPARQRAFTDLIQRWHHVPRDSAAAAIPSGPVLLRYASYEEPNEDYDIHREGSAVLVAAMPDSVSATQWRLVSEEFPCPARFRIGTSVAFDSVENLDRSTGTVTIGDVLTVQPR